MSMITEVKCRRCGETFSSLRSRCPSCGTRRVTQSGRTPAPTPSTVKGTPAYERAETNTKWQIIFGLILVAAVILAVIVMVSTSLQGADVAAETPVITPPTVSNYIPEIETAPTPPPTPTPTVESIRIMFFNKEIETDFLMHLGEEPLTFTAQVLPLTIQGAKVNWKSSDESVLKVTPIDDLSCQVEIVGTIAGGVKLTAECLGVEKTVTAYCVP